MVPSEGMADVGTGGFRKCDGEQGAGRVLMEQKKKKKMK